MSSRDPVLECSGEGEVGMWGIFPVRAQRSSPRSRKHRMSSGQSHSEF